MYLLGGGMFRPKTELGVTNDISSLGDWQDFSERIFSNSLASTGKKLIGQYEEASFFDLFGL